MLKKRLIGVVTVKNGMAVQSFGFNRYLPLGKPQCLVENLDRWGADEVLILNIDRTRAHLGPDFELLERLARLGLGTPLIYAGGIRSIEDGVRVIQLGADRLAVDALLHDDITIVRGLSERLGAQAVIAALPLSHGVRSIKWLNYRNGATSPIPDSLVELISAGVVSEALVIDWQHEGQPGGFDRNLIAQFPIEDVPLIAFGGLSDPDEMLELLSAPRVAAVAIGNFLNYREHAVQSLKEALTGAPLRLPQYDSNYSLLVDA
jgi:imidazole glycerol-phosphate synthase subunit HisF